MHFFENPGAIFANMFEVLQYRKLCFGFVKCWLKSYYTAFSQYKNFLHKLRRKTEGNMGFHNIQKPPRPKRCVSQNLEENSTQQRHKINLDFLIYNFQPIQKLATKTSPKKNLKKVKFRNTQNPIRPRRCATRSFKKLSRNKGRG